MNIKQALAFGAELLKNKSQTAQLDAEILLAFVLKKKRSYLVSHFEDKLKVDVEKEYRNLVRRRAEMEPVAYLVNKKEFYGIELYVDENVLIPRPETENLVEYAIDEIEDMSNRPNCDTEKIALADIGCGSGAIGLAIAVEVSKLSFDHDINFKVLMSDVSEEALAVSQKNVNRLEETIADNVEVVLKRSDLLEGLSSGLDIILSNPPYIPRSKIAYLDKNVREYEPYIALNGGKNGLEFIPELIEQANSKLVKKGVLMFEMYEDHYQKVEEIVKKHYPDLSISFKKDQWGIVRFAILRKV